MNKLNKKDATEFTNSLMYSGDYGDRYTDADIVFMRAVEAVIGDAKTKTLFVFSSVDMDIDDMEVISDFCLKSNEVFDFIIVLDKIILYFCKYCTELLAKHFPEHLNYKTIHYELMAQGASENQNDFVVSFLESVGQFGTWEGLFNSTSVAFFNRTGSYDSKVILCPLIGHSDPLETIQFDDALTFLLIESTAPIKTYKGIPFSAYYFGFLNNSISEWKVFVGDEAIKDELDSCGFAIDEALVGDPDQVEEIVMDSYRTLLEAMNKKVFS